jgi:hypothetical protein
MGLRRKNGQEPTEAFASRAPGMRPHTPPFDNEKDALLLAGNRATAHGGRRPLWLILLAAYMAFMLWRGWGGGDESASAWRWNGVNQFPGWIAGLAFASLREFAYYVPVGFLAAVGGCRGSKQGHRFLFGVLALVAAVSLTIVAHAGAIVRSWPAWTSVRLAVPLLGGLFGVWAGATWLRGWRARLLFLPKAALLASVPILCLGVLVWLSLEAEPLPVNSAEVTSEEKRRLVALVRSKDPRSLEKGQTHTLSLTEHDLDVLLAWGLSIGLPGGKATVDLEQDSASLSLSAAIPFRGGSRYLNLVLTGGAKIRDGTLAVDVQRCTAGSVQIPRRLLDACIPIVASWLNRDSRFKPFVAATREIAIEPGLVNVTYGSVDLPPGYRESFVGATFLSEEVLASARVQIAHLLAVVGQVPKPRPTFDFCLETVFVLAKERSVGRDPVEENQAAILALGALLGHSQIEEFLGPVPVEAKDHAARQALFQIRLRDRSDWTRHFCVSAAIALFSTAAVSDAAGLLKEELDAGTGGSGFSFADLLADRAGTTFAVCATRDPAAALAMQNRLAGGFRVDDFFPPADDLPEGIPAAELQRQYGGVGGPAYREMVEEIERRVTRCAAYR